MDLWLAEIPGARLTAGDAFSAERFGKSNLPHMLPDLIGQAVL